MKILRVERLIDTGGFSSTDVWRRIETNIIDAIRSVQWPPNSGSFTLYDESGKGRGAGSG